MNLTCFIQRRFQNMFNYQTGTSFQWYLNGEPILGVSGSMDGSLSNSGNNFKATSQNNVANPKENFEDPANENMEKRIIGSILYVRAVKLFHAGKYTCRSPDKNLHASLDATILSSMADAIIFSSFGILKAAPPLNSG